MSTNDWYAEILRKPTEKGPGVLSLFKNDELVGQWDVITGGAEANAYKLGGLTPPIEWIMIEPIAYRRHPKGHRMEMARLIPVGDKTEYSNRTFSIHDWPFMIHVAGRSSGCPAIRKDQWKECKKALNAAFEESHFIIDVYDDDDDEDE